MPHRFAVRAGVGALSLVVHAVLRTSLSCDPSIRAFARHEDAVKHLKDVLVAEGWPSSAAMTAAEEGTSVLVADDGDSDEIRIVTLSVTE